MKELQEILRGRSRALATQGVLDSINEALNIDDTDQAEVVKNNMISMVDVLVTGRYKIEDYMNAVRFVSYKLVGETNVEAYRKTFPDRFQRMFEKYEAMGLDEDEIIRNRISAFATAYNKNKLVSKLTEQTIVPSHIINAPYYQQAVGVLADLMVNARSEMVRFNAANSLVQNLKTPEVVKMELDVGVKQNDVIDDLRKVTQELAAQSRNAIASGAITSRAACEMQIIEADVEDSE